MASEPTGAAAPFHAPIGRDAFFLIRLTRDPEEAYAAVCRILATVRDPEQALAECSDYVGGFGVERLPLADGSTLLYVNVGDTYKVTLCHFVQRPHGYFVEYVDPAAEREAASYFVSSWGNVYEESDRQHEEATGERRCVYCSEWCEEGEPCGACGRDPSTGEEWTEGGAS